MSQLGVFYPIGECRGCHGSGLMQTFCEARREVVPMLCLVCDGHGQLTSVQFWPVVTAEQFEALLVRTLEGGG
jgi:hypothetical protein